jgi:hypothetical protein
MIINFRVYEISWDACKLVWIPTLIIIIKKKKKKKRRHRGILGENMLVAEYENQAHDLVFVFLQVHYISVYISTETLATDYYKKERIIIIIIIIIAPKLHFPKQISLWISSASSPRYKFTIYLLQISLLFEVKSLKIFFLLQS